MFLKRRIMKTLIDLDKRAYRSYMAVYDFKFSKCNQIKLIEVCETLVTEEKLAEWECEPHYPELRIRATELGNGYFARKRFNRKSYWAGVASGVIVTVVSGLILFKLTGVV